MGYEIRRIYSQPQTTRSDLGMYGVLTSHLNNIDIYEYADKDSPLVSSFKRKLRDQTYRIFQHTCPICKLKNEFTLVAESIEGFKWGLCKGCGLLQIYNRFGMDDLNQFYRGGEYQAICMRNIDDKTHFCFRISGYEFIFYRHI